MLAKEHKINVYEFKISCVAVKYFHSDNKLYNIISDWKTVYSRFLQIFKSVVRFSIANFLIYQPIPMVWHFLQYSIQYQPDPMLWPFVGIVSRRRFQQMVTTQDSTRGPHAAETNARLLFPQVHKGAYYCQRALKTYGPGSNCSLCDAEQVFDLS